MRPPLFPEAHLVPGEDGREHYAPGAELRIWRSPRPSPIFLKSLELNPFLSKVCCARWAPGKHTPAEGFSRGGMCKLGSTACWLVICNNLRRWGQPRVGRGARSPGESGSLALPCGILVECGFNFCLSLPFWYPSWPHTGVCSFLLLGCSKTRAWQTEFVKMSD